MGSSSIFLFCPIAATAAAQQVVSFKLLGPGIKGNYLLLPWRQFVKFCTFYTVPQQAQFCVNPFSFRCHYIPGIWHDVQHTLNIHQKVFQWVSEWMSERMNECKCVENFKDAQAWGSAVFLWANSFEAYHLLYSDLSPHI